MINRPRRLRMNSHIRGLMRETRVSPDSLIYPVFLVEGENIKNPIPSLPGLYQFSPDRINEEIEDSLKHGVSKFMLFGIPKVKDEVGSGAYSENGIVQQGIKVIRKNFKDEVYLIGDVCMCEYTDHGHCGILDGCDVDNDKTLEYIAKIALSQVKAGADMVAPSDMMDGRIKAIRAMLDENGYINTPIMSYAAKYSSAFYGPFRDAAGSAPSFGNRKSYQMDFHNKKEAIKEVLTDVEEGADIIMIKPALSYLDVISETAAIINLPVAAYSVSGEYAMIKAGGQLGVINEYDTMCESAISIYRAGAEILITYFAKELADAMRKGDIG